MTETLLDQAYHAAEADPDNTAPRLEFYARLIASELYLLLEQEAEKDQLTPKVFALEDGPIVLAFDTEARLSEFTGLPAPYAAVTGRALVEMLLDSDPALGLGLNLGVAPSSRLLPPEIIAWLGETLSERPSELSFRARALHPPKGLPEQVLGALDARLAQMEGLAEMAYLVSAEYEGGQRGHLLAFIDSAPGAETALARAVQSALSLSGVEAGLLDVTFMTASDPRAAGFARVGLRFDLPRAAPRPARKAPGSDPRNPPRLR